MDCEEIIELKAITGNPVSGKEFGGDGVYNANKSSTDRNVVIKVLRREISSGLESVKIQLRTVPSRPDKASQ